MIYRNSEIFKKWLYPLLFFQIYLSITIVAFFVGPWDWQIDNSGLLITYLISAQLFMAIGYLYSWKKIRLHISSENEKINNNKYGIEFLKRSLIVTFVMLIPTSLSRTGQLFPDIFAGISDAGDAYNQNYYRLKGGNPFVIVEYLRMAFSPMLIAIIPLGILYWTQLSLAMKTSVVLAIILNLFIYVATGTNKGVADFLITAPWIVYLSISMGLMKFEKIRRLALILSLAILILAFLIFFGIGQSLRSGGVGEHGVFYAGNRLVWSDKSHYLSAILPDNLRIIFESLTRYVGSGYYALALSFGIEHNSTYGIGNSMFTARNADFLFRTDYFTWESLPGKLESQTGYGMFTLWHSIYTWYASDFGFIGTLGIMGLFSYLLGLSWGKSMLTSSPIWVLLFYLLLILFYYIPANNQIFQSGETYICFVIIVFYLIFGIGRKNA